MDTILIADSGSTKTDWLWIRQDGATVDDWSSQGINPFFQNAETISVVMEKEVFPRVTSMPDQIFFYGAGCASAAVSAPVYQVLSMKFPSARITVESDLLGAARSLCRQSKGIACILGTGSNNCLYNGDSIMGNIGSLGFWMGDEGSGGHLGKQLVLGYLHKELPEQLMAAFASDYPDVNRMEVLDRAYKQPFPNRYFAGFSRFISQHKDHEFIQALVMRSFETFLEKYVLKHPGAEGYPVSFVGSVAWHFREILGKALELKGLRAGEIAQRPMPGLSVFHSSAHA